MIIPKRIREGVLMPPTFQLFNETQQARLVSTPSQAATMCGIGFLLGAGPPEQSELESYVGALRRRGPDADKQTTIDLEV